MFHRNLWRRDGQKNRSLSLDPPRHVWLRPQLEVLEDRTVPDTTPAAVQDPNLEVTTVVSGLSQPIGIVFLSTNDFFVLEKASGQVKRVIGGVIQPTPVLDLAVNSNSERGLLSMALHPNFPVTPFVYIRWTESSIGADTNVATNVPFLGNRVDRYIWNGSTLTFDQNIIQLRALQTDNIAVPGHPGTANGNAAGNHNGGVIKFGPDGKLYIFMGDLGRRSQLQNLANGPFLTSPLVDDTFGGPAPDNAHFTGMILRLNDDGTTPTDNPFFAVGAATGGEVGANIQRIYSYGHRNGFGMAFDPVSGFLWETENADDAYSELNRIIPGMNGGWVQFAGPISRIDSFKFIETTQFNSSLQQVRFPPTRIAYTSALALSRLYMLPGAIYVDPDLSWRYEIGPAGTTFVSGNALGAEYNGTLWMGSARSNQMVGGNGGSLYRMKLTSDRLHIDVSSNPLLADRVADNLFTPTKFDGTESETLRIGTGFGITPAIEQGPDGNLYVVSNTDNVIYKISRIPPFSPPPPFAPVPNPAPVGSLGDELLTNANVNNGENVPVMIKKTDISFFKDNGPGLPKISQTQLKIGLFGGSSTTVASLAAAFSIFPAITSGQIIKEPESTVIFSDQINKGIGSIVTSLTSDGNSANIPGNLNNSDTGSLAAELPDNFGINSDWSDLLGVELTI